MIARLHWELNGKRKRDSYRWHKSFAYKMPAPMIPFRKRGPARGRVSEHPRLAGFKIDQGLTVTDDFPRDSQAVRLSKKTRRKGLADL